MAVVLLGRRGGGLLGGNKRSGAGLGVMGRRPLGVCGRSSHLMPQSPAEAVPKLLNRNL